MRRSSTPGPPGAGSHGEAASPGHRAAHRSPPAYHPAARGAAAECPLLGTLPRNPTHVERLKTPGKRHLKAISWIKSLAPQLCRPIPVSRCVRASRIPGASRMIPDYPGLKLLIVISYNDADVRMGSTPTSVG